MAKSIANAGYRCAYCMPGRVRRLIKPRELFLASKRGKWVALEDVPIGVCDRCGERYHHAYVLRQAEAVHANRVRTRKLRVPVARFVRVSEGAIKPRAKSRKAVASDFPCDFCGRGWIRPVVEPRVFFPDPGDGRLVALENVPVGDCDRCGEHHYSAVVLSQVDILRRKKMPSRMISIPVARYVPPA